MTVTMQALQDELGPQFEVRELRDLGDVMWSISTPYIDPSRDSFRLCVAGDSAGLVSSATLDGELGRRAGQYAVTDLGDWSHYYSWTDGIYSSRLAAGYVKRFTAPGFLEFRNNLFVAPVPPNGEKTANDLAMAVHVVGQACVRMTALGGIGLLLQGGVGLGE